MVHTRHAAPSSQPSRRDTVVTFVVVLLAYGAFDDITTDRDTSFVVEWVALAVCAVWLGVVVWRLLRDGHRWLGSISIGVWVAGVGAGAMVRPGADLLPIAFLTVIASLLWFLALAAILARQTARQYRRSDHHV